MHLYKFKAWFKEEKRFLTEVEINQYYVYYFFDWAGLEVYGNLGLLDKNKKEAYEGDLIKDKEGKLIELTRDYKLLAGLEDFEILKHKRD